MFEILKDLKNAEEKSRNILIESKEKADLSIKKAREKGKETLNQLAEKFNKQKEEQLETTKTELETETKDIEDKGTKDISELKKNAVSNKTAAIDETKKAILK